MNFAFRAENRDRFRFTIEDRRILGDHLVYTLRFEPRSSLTPFEPSGRVWVDDDAAAINAGSVFCVPRGATQWVENEGTVALEFLCLVDPPWRAEDEEVFE